MDIVRAPGAPVHLGSRLDVVNALIAARGYTRYLEIGCQGDLTFAHVNAPVRVGVDPVSGGNKRMTSDEFFDEFAASPPEERKPFDLIFIDGDHRHEQVTVDIRNALDNLAPGGAIVMHDCLPPNAEYEYPNHCGTAWRSFAFYRQDLRLDAITCDFDYGVGIIRRGNNPDPIHIGRPLALLSYLTFERNRARWMRPRDAKGAMEFIHAWPDTVECALCRGTGRIIDVGVTCNVCGGDGTAFTVPEKK